MTEAMVEKVFASVLGGMEVLSIALGDRLGFYALLAEGPLPRTTSPRGPAPIRGGPASGSSSRRSSAT